MLHQDSRTYIADLHLHSKYAYATSKRLSLEGLSAWAKIKGIDLLSCADFTHPLWTGELLRGLVEDGTGLFEFSGVKFVLGSEVSCVYRQGGRVRRVHMLVFAPDWGTVATLNRKLGCYGNLTSDGRPTLRMSARDLVESVLEVNPECLVIPAHIWTPWYGVLGSRSGFDSLEECFLDMASHVCAVETGLSSDPAMNWNISELDGRTIVSFSDAHSLANLGREATVFQGRLSYRGLAQALATQGVAYTIEFHPEVGKYHFSGHRKCGVRQGVREAVDSAGLCPVCGRALTQGVMHRVAGLSHCDAPAGLPNNLDDAGLIPSPRGRPPFMRLVPLVEIIAQTLRYSITSKRVQNEYLRLVDELGSEFTILVQTPFGDLAHVGGENLAQTVMMVRAGRVRVDPGYDGVYGSVSLSPIGDFKARTIQALKRGGRKIKLDNF